MIIKINAEQPFQVLSTTFSIGPSSSGYDLMASADGVNYSKLFTVGANVNRQVTQVAAGSYYYLSGNTDSAVTVNWFGNCVDGNGGGGSYVLPVASDSTLGGIKVGSGLSIDSGGTLSTSGGDDWAWYSVEEYNEMSKGDRGSLYDEIKDLVENGETKIGFYSYTEDTDEYDNTILNYERYVFSHYQDGQIYFQGVFAYRNIEDDEDENGYFVSKCLRLDRAQTLQWYNYDSSESALNKLSAVEKLDEEVNDPQAGDVAAKKIVKYNYVKFAWDSIPAFNGDNIIELGNLVVTADVENATDTLYFSNDYDQNEYTLTGGTDYVDFAIYNEDGTSWFVAYSDGIIGINLRDSIDEDTILLDESIITLNECDAYMDEETAIPDGLYQYNGEEWEKIGARVILLNNLSQSELVDLYDEITAMYDYDNMEFTTAFTASNYAFYLDLTDSTKQTNIGVYDRNFEGWFPVVLNYVNPNDYDGGAIYFTGVEGRQDGNGYLFNIRYIVTNQGDTEAGCWSVEPPQPDYQHAIQITSGGTFENTDELGIFSSENFNHKVMFVWREGNDQPGWGQAPLKYVWRKLDQDSHLIYHFAVENIAIDGVLYKGSWHATEDDWGNYTTDTWTTV